MWKIGYASDFFIFFYFMLVRIIIQHGVCLMIRTDSGGWKGSSGHGLIFPNLGYWDFLLSSSGSQTTNRIPCEYLSFDDSRDRWFRIYLVLEGVIIDTWQLTVSKPSYITGTGIIPTSGAFWYRFLPTLSQRSWRFRKEANVPRTWWYHDFNPGTLNSISVNSHQTDILCIICFKPVGLLKFGSFWHPLSQPLFAMTENGKLSKKKTKKTTKL